MTKSLGIVLCIAYSMGLLLSRAAGFLIVWGLSLPWSGIIGCLLIPLSIVIAPSHFTQGLKAKQGLWIGSIFLLATLYITLRSPTPGPQDISHFIDRAQAIAPTQIITGKLIDEPRLNRDLKGRFRIATKQLQILDDHGEITFQIPVKGRLYVTAPLLQVTGLHSGQWIKAKGRLYLPQSAKNPNGFDFKAYLTQKETFTGFVTEKLVFQPKHHWGLWQIRQRIVRSQVRALGSPQGQLVSAMSLGRKAVDLPQDIQDLFSKVGLAHTIAASGFHVSLMLGTVLALLRSRPDRTQVIAGGLSLVGYLALTGLQASVIRAALMGVATLAGLATHRKVIPSGALLIAVTLMLLFDPNWVWQVGFQLSVVATWGLIVTVPVLTKHLDWMPITLASLIAVPIAATVWTLPLMLYYFNVLSGSSLILNIIATPLISIISLGGIASSAVSLVFPAIGSTVAQLLYYPLQALLWLAQTFSKLPGSAIAIGQITLWQLVGLYSILLFGLWGVRSRAVHLLLALSFITLILGPIGWRSLTQYQVTVLATGKAPVWVMQDQGQTTLVNSGDEKTAFYTVNPFLKQAGINQIENAIALPFQQDNQSGWQSLLRQTPAKHLYSNDDSSLLSELVQTFHPLTLGQNTSLQKLQVQLLDNENPILRLTTLQQSWLLLPSLSLGLQNYLAESRAIPSSEVLLWNGDDISNPFLKRVQPQVAICYGHTLSEAMERHLQQQGIQVYWTERDGAITWQPHHGFHSYLKTNHRNASLWG
ncbi:ComEC/Rec2 family competence protein [Oscillatoria sp. CS-180]|uniref:ComEC/Rec2 family competence protein n=1 Tax=Oscillatoria sp. CS-180 TaxID=3021720 RepID=UPI00232C3A57|nr:ComEC/Rec2 family competence protein [Oscillatoria sp. CS-180]MDB9527800.1 ComEC/Rec2 family competence protein [Oscillatoria sp. CS-180]